MTWVKQISTFTNACDANTSPVKYTTIQIALFLPMSFMLHYIPNLQMEYCQEAAVKSVSSERITG